MGLKEKFWLTEELPRGILSSKQVLRRSEIWMFELGGLFHMLCFNVTEHAAAKSVATVLLDFRAHPETAGPLA
jgi:hypothetical protein